MKKRGKKRIEVNNPIFLVGLTLFLLGFLGGIWQLFWGGRTELNQIFSDKAWGYVEVDFGASNFKNLQKKMGEFSPQEILDPISRLSGVELDVLKIEPWAGTRLGVAFLEDKQFVFAAEYRNKTKAKKFLETFLLSGDTLQEKEMSYGKIYTSGFSSQMVFAFSSGWLFWADSETSLARILSSESKLAENPKYQKIKNDLPDNALVSMFLNLEDGKPSENLSPEWTPYLPLINSLGQIIPAAGASITVGDSNLKIHTKFLASEHVYKDTLVSKPTNKTVPDLAYLTPKNVVFFMNGDDLYSKYEYTKEFLKELDPQLELVFEGIFRAQSKKIFGEDFDFQKDFLLRLRGSYAFLLDFENRLKFAFIAKTETEDQKNIETLKSAILSAQSQFIPRVETVELPDGTKREELVATDLSGIPVKSEKVGTYEYFTTIPEFSESAFAYAVISPYFIFSNDSFFMREILETFQNLKPNLAENEDFRTSVLFDFVASESYGFLNFPKFSETIDFLSQMEISEEPSVRDSFSFWQKNARNLVFSKIVKPGEIFVKAILFLNEP